MSNLREAAEQALLFIESGTPDRPTVIEAPRSALAEPEPEPVATVTIHGVVGVSFHENCDYGCSLKEVTLLYTRP